MKTGRVIAAAFALLFAATSGQAQSDADLAALRATFALGETEFNGPQQGQSLVRFDEIVTRLEAERRQNALTDAGEQLLVSAYEYRARLFFNLGNTDKATESFRALITLDPEHTLDQALISPKVVEFFRRIKTQMVGFVTVQSVPQGAAVLLNGRGLSVTDFFPIEVVAGDYTLDITKNGYRTESRPVTVAAGETLSLQFDLVRTSATGYVITEPAEVEVLIDGVRKGVTSGLLDPAMAAVAAARGLDPARASSRLEIQDLPAGSHTLEFRKPCYEPLTVSLDVPEPQDYDIPPVRLEPSIGTVSLTSEPPGGQIFIDGESQGVAPKTLRSVCAGVRRVEVRHAAGRFVQDVDLKPRAVVEIAAQIRPTLAWLGVVTDGPSGERVRAAMDARLVRLATGAIRGMNFLRADPAVLEKTLAAERVRLADLLPPAVPDAALVRRVFEKLAAALDVQGFLVARIPEEAITRSAALHVLAAGSVVPDSAPVTIEEDASYARFFATFEKKAPLRAPSAGLVALDTKLHEGPVVARVTAGSPAEKAGLARGDVIVAAGARKIAVAADLEAAIAATGAGKPLSLTIKAAAGPRTVDVPLENAPREIPDPGALGLANKISMDLRQLIEGYPGSENAAFARLNLGLIALGQRDYAGAHDAFVKAKNELPGTPGLSRGTAAFYAGVALEHLGYSKEALEEFTQASLDEGATLFSAEGPKVKDIARRRIAALSGGR